MASRAGAGRVLAKLEALRWSFGPAPARARRAALRALLPTRLGSASLVVRLHELLLAARAYPDDAVTLALAERSLAGFGARADVRRLRSRLTDSGITGCDIRFPFFAPTARGLAARWPRQLEIDWPELEDGDALEAWLPLLVHEGEVPGLDEYDYGPRGWLARLRSPQEADGAFVARSLHARLERADDNAAVFERVHDGLALPYRLRGDATTPSRTRARWPAGRVHFQRDAFAGRPDLAAAGPPRAVRALPVREGERALALAMECMVTRSRDLDVFSWGDARDVRHVDCGDGLAFLMIGARPERRLLLESVYGFLTLKNGVPVGYVLTSALYGSAELAFNVFDTFRGAEAGPVYGKVVGMTRALFGADMFTIPPYQLGDGNDEAIESGAWWFYQKLGFRPHTRACRALMRRELARMRRTPGYRSGPAVLRRLARENLFCALAGERRDVLGKLPFPSAGLAVTQLVARRFAGDRARAAAACERDAQRRLGLGSFAGWSADERQAWSRWAPLVTLLTGLERWSPGERQALAAVIRAKGGPREDAFVRAFDAHPKLAEALARLVRSIRT
jgi:hypothetical protein